MNNTQQLSASRIELAKEALHELSQLVDVLRGFIAERDASGDVQYVARGMLARMRSLADAAGECIESDADERWSDEMLVKVIEGRLARTPDSLQGEAA